MDSANPILSPSANVSAPEVSSMGTISSAAVMPALLHGSLLMPMVALTFVTAEASSHRILLKQDSGPLQFFAAADSSHPGDIGGIFAAFEQSAQRAARAAALNEARARIDQFAFVDFAQRNDEATPPNVATRAIARAAVDQLPDGVLVPHISAGVRGTVGLEWETSKAYLAAEVQTDGTFVWIERRNGMMIDGDEGAWTGVLPKTFVSRLVNAYE